MAEFNKLFNHMRKIILPIGIAFLFAFTTACQTKSKEEVVEMKEMDEFDLSDISANPKEPTQEEIIAAAEEAAFAGQE